MEAQEKTQPLKSAEVQEMFQVFLDSMTTLDELIREENSPEEIDRIHEELDQIYEVGEEVYCQMVGTSKCLPDNYADIPRIIEQESEATGVPKPRIEAEYRSVLAEHGDISAESAWVKTRDRVQRRKKMMDIAAGVTCVDDWQ